MISYSAELSRLLDATWRTIISFPARQTIQYCFVAHGRWGATAWVIVTTTRRGNWTLICCFYHCHSACAHLWCFSNLRRQVSFTTTMLNKKNKSRNSCRLGHILSFHDCCSSTCFNGGAPSIGQVKLFIVLQLARWRTATSAATAASASPRKNWVIKIAGYYLHDSLLVRQF